MDFFRLLHEGVPLGIGDPIPPCKVLFPPDQPSKSVLPLQHCDSAWKSALDHADLVDDLLATELQKAGSARSREAILRSVPERSNSCKITRVLDLLNFV